MAQHARTTTPAPTRRNDRTTPLLGWLSAATLAAGVALTFLAPPDYQQAYLTRILPVHAAAAQVAYVAFFTTLVCSVLYLVRRELRFDRLALASTEVGIVFIVFTLFSGSLWGRVTWGTYWQWEPRLTTTALLLAAYVGYMMVRGLIEDPHRRARVAAAIGVVAAIGVPINYMSVYWWRSLHQLPSISVTQGRSFLSGNPLLQTAYFVVAIALTLTFAYLMRRRAIIARRQAQLEERDMELELAAVPQSRGVTS